MVENRPPNVLNLGRQKTDRRESEKYVRAMGLEILEEIVSKTPSA